MFYPHLLFYLCSIIIALAFKIKRFKIDGEETCSPPSKKQHTHKNIHMKKIKKIVYR